MEFLRPSLRAFDLYADRYDRWYDLPFGASAFSLELECLRRLVSLKGPSVEIGVGSGRFAQALGVNYGMDISWGLLRRAKGRGIRVVQASVEKLPFKDGVFGGVLIVVSLCFFENPMDAFKEARRVISPEGSLVLGLVLSESPWADFYRKKAHLRNLKTKDP